MVERKKSTRTTVTDDKRVVSIAPPARAGQPYSGALQENLLAVLCHRNEGREVANLLNPALFEGDYRVVAERAVAYWKEYDRPPGPHTADLLSDILAKDDRRAGTFRSVLIEMLRLADSDHLNMRFILDGIKTFHQQQTLLLAMQGSLQGFQNNGDPKAAIARANELITEAMQDHGQGRLIARSVGSFEPRKHVWVKKPFFVRGVLNLLVGDGGLGKTLIAIDRAARLSRKGQATIILTVEDEAAIDLRPRMEAAGGDPDLLLVLGVEDGEDFDVIDGLGDKRLREIERIIAARGDVGMIVIDPISDFAGNKTDHNTESEVRRMLRPIRALARRHDLLAIIVLHLNKKSDTPASGRIMGSVAYRNVPRSVLFVVADPDEPERTLMIQTKTNYVSRDMDNAIGFTTRMRRGAVAPSIAWEKELQRADIDELMGGRPPGRPRKQEAAVELLRELLADGPVAVPELQAVFEERGISWSTANRVKDEAGIKSNQQARAWTWELLP